MYNHLLQYALLPRVNLLTRSDYLFITKLMDSTNCGDSSLKRIIFPRIYTTSANLFSKDHRVYITVLKMLVP